MRLEYSTNGPIHTRKDSMTTTKKKKAENNNNKKKLVARSTLHSCPKHVYVSGGTGGLGQFPSLTAAEEYFR
eukprot:m.489404 g.489404  ORF g.489404 m.489404 type:complete len:72 (-) comp21766_c0_seq3:225-440(-)